MRHVSSRLGALAAVLSLTLLVGAPEGRDAYAQGEEGATGGGEFFEAVEVFVVDLDVYVTDEDGDPVTGLSAEDFEVVEDGSPVTITNFEEVRPDPGEAGDAPARGVEPPTDLPVVEGAAPREEVASPDERLYLIVYVDNFNIMPFHRNRVFRSVREFLREHVTARDKVMLMTYDRSLERRVPFTSNESLVSKELFEIEEESGYGVHRHSERRDTLRAIEEAESQADAMTRIESYAGSYYNDVMVSIDAMRDLVSSLGGLPGRKAFLSVSDGLPMVAAEDMFLALQEKFDDTTTFLYSRRYDASRRFEELAALANSNRVSFYTIDAAGLRTMTSASVESAHAGTSAFVDSQNAQNLQASLLTLAEKTGGRAIINTNDVGPVLDRIGDQLHSYYSVAYRPPHAGDGRYHTVEVRVKGRRDLDVRHRTGYRAKTIEQQMSDSTLAALQYGEEANRHGLRLRFGSSSRREGGHFTIPIQVRFPLEKVTLVQQPQRDLYIARLQVSVAAMDEEGNMSEVQQVPVSIEIPGGDVETAREKAWQYEIPLLMRSGRHRVAVGLRDQLGGDESFVAAPIVVGTG